ncbi:Similar to hypothetical protein CIMG_06322 [Coccidioides immitis RS]; acc. no. XP_001242426 [Pyronema omphalodes CBS 100304]|uniref:Peptidase S9 prolyl oligopeptidase catalytic domain-containing protein n=1 Tax=Pyronema omphalodes (strain CBS 100304) TaxID=1076935 RepID=U4L8K4_PYROM|nr:Similar to hypothetical protein CIMG_06322 [Coccidioides immitis RS]; acc. no. XP_001242426 [Pyronema omphalodes CBS 100304]
MYLKRVLCPEQPMGCAWPFPEAEWSADSLTYHGGFHSLNRSNSTYPSSLTEDGTVGWSTTPLKDNRVDINFPDVDWTWHRSVYGWSALQTSSWARGVLTVCGDEDKEKVFRVYITGAGEFWVGDKQYFGGDFFSYQRSPVVIRLKPGQHVLEVRATGDVRAFGGVSNIGFGVKIEEGGGVTAGEVVVPDLGEGGGLVSEWVSVGVRNEENEWVVVTGVKGKGLEIREFGKVRLAPGQTRPVKFRVADMPANITKLDLGIRYQIEGSKEKEKIINVSTDLTKVGRFEPQKYTFLHPSGIVSFADLRPPSINATCSSNKLPILPSLHGAGVDASSPQSKSGYDSLPDLCAWLLLPSGVTTWSGDDWHRWGLPDVEAAISAIPAWIQKTKWQRQDVDLKKWLVTGHSNGGQGTWYLLSHRSDNVIAAAPLSGYLSIPAYVPYNLWHESDPRAMGQVKAALTSYNHALVVPNMIGTPIYQQHGAADDNVPAWHSRRMHELLVEAGGDSAYAEVQGKGHFWEGVMTEGKLGGWLEEQLERGEVLELREKFEVIVASPGDMGSRGGILVEQVVEEGVLAKMVVTRSGDVWMIETSNVRRWRFGPERQGMPRPTRVMVDEHDLKVPGNGGTFLLSDDGAWIIDITEKWTEIERYGTQWGGLDAILSSTGPFTIVTPPSSEGYYDDIALDVARNLYQYFAADTVLSNSYDGATGNAIHLGSESCGPVGVTATHLEILTSGGRKRRYKLETGMGAVWLCPLDGGRLKMMVWGMDEAGMRLAARLVPTRTGVGAPAFVVLGEEAKWKGVGGVKAIGAVDYRWRASEGAFLG